MMTWNQNIRSQLLFYGRKLMQLSKLDTSENPVIIIILGYN